MAKDQYGIEWPGGNTGAWSAKRWKNTSFKMTWEETMACLALAGWPRDKRALAAAVMSAESGRNPFIYNTYRKGHFGVFQISRSAWPDFFGSSGMAMNWMDPTQNAQKAYAIYKAQGWKAWEGYTNGGYLAYYPAAMTAMADFDRKTAVHPNDERGYWSSILWKRVFPKLLSVSGAADKIGGVAAGGVADAIEGAAGATAEGVMDAGGAVAATVSDMFITDLWATLTNPGVWMRVAYGATGIVLIVGGLMLITRNSPAMQKINSTAKAVATRGAVK